MLGQHQQEEEGVGEEELLGGVRALDVHHDDAGGEHAQEKFCYVCDCASKVGNSKRKFSKSDPLKGQPQDEDADEMEYKEDEELEVSY